MNRILEVDPGSRTTLAEACVVQDQLNRAAAPLGLMFGPDTSTQ
jgi:FAD/FMN-containing dehydrogenase